MPIAFQSSLLHNLRFAFLLGTLLLPFAVIILMKSSDFWSDTLLAWVLLLVASLLIKLYTDFKRRTEKVVGGWWANRKKKKEPAPDPEPDPVMERAASMPYLPTGFIHEVGTLEYVGGIISMGVGMFPALLVLIPISEFFPDFKDILGGRLTVALAGAISVTWMLFLERKYAIHLTSPLFGLPLKWVLIPIFIFLAFYGDPNK